MTTDHEDDWACPACGDTTRSVIQCAIECRARNERAAAVREARRPSECNLDDFPAGDALDHEAAYDLFEALRDATANTWHEIAARHLAYHRARTLSLSRPVSNNEAK